MVAKNKLQRLSQIIPKNELVEQLEDILCETTLIIDEGYFLEVYINFNGVNFVHPDDINVGNVDRGIHNYYYIDEELTYGELLKIFSIGSIKEDTMTIKVIPCYDDFFKTEREKSQPISLRLKMINGNIA